MNPDGAEAGIYETIYRRRDVRAQFDGRPVSAEVLDRVLAAAHAAPSVGLSQPWDFILIDEPSLKEKFWSHVQRERDHFACTLDSERRELFAAIKIEGVLESSLSIVVTYDHRRGAPAVLGRHAIADSGLYSTCLAIENLWLAATAEGLGVGWVSFYRETFVRDLLLLPEELRPIAWLCLGTVTHLESAPDLERFRWARRRPLSAAMHHNGWEVRDRGDQLTGSDWVEQSDAASPRPAIPG